MVGFTLAYAQLFEAVLNDEAISEEALSVSDSSEQLLEDVLLMEDLI